MVSLIVTAISALLALNASRSLKKNQDDFGIYANAAGYRIQKLAFCHDNSVKPCNDESLIEWNKANPDNLFMIKNGNQIVE